MEKFSRNFFSFAAFSIFSLFVFSCGKSSDLSSIHREEKFTLGYGNLEDQINLFDLNSTGEINTRIAMRDGFFFISNGKSQKILQMNSYGDLLTLYHNPETNPAPLFDENVLADASNYSTRKTVSYPFHEPSFLAMDSRLNFYVVETLPKERQEVSDGKNLRQVVLHFDSDSFVDYIGQQGHGGTPFPYIKNIYTTADDCLFVVCIVSEGFEVFCYNSDGNLLHDIIVRHSDIPDHGEAKAGVTRFVEVENIVPDFNSARLFMKADFYENSLDSKGQGGVGEVLTVIFPYDLSSGVYGKPIEIPPYEESITQGFAKQTYKLPYDFMGVSDSTWLFFTIAVDSGFVVQMVHADSSRIVRRLLNYDTKDTVYSAFNLSASGIISALIAGQENAKVVWWRTDDLTRSFAENE